MTTLMQRREVLDLIHNYEDTAVPLMAAGQVFLLKAPQAMGPFEVYRQDSRDWKEQSAAKDDVWPVQDLFRAALVRSQT